MKLKKLRLKNFKGLRDFTLEPDGCNISIYGANATGKTTIMDGFLWLLFGKDSLNQANFEIKSLTETGEPEHNLEHEVTAVMTDGTNQVALKKRLTEKWTKRRGSRQQEFTGHTVDHWIDGVPVNQRDYLARVASIAPEETFRLLTNPRHFSEHLKWQDRRRILLEVCGDLTDAQIIESSDELSGLPDILGKRKLDEHRKVIAARRTEINRELEQVPVRISELRGTLPSDAADPKTIRSVLAQLRTERAEKEAERSRLATGGEIARTNKELAEIDAQLIALSNRRASAADAAMQAMRNRKGGLLEALSRHRADLAGLQSAIERTAALIEEGNAALEALRALGIKTNAETFEYAPELVCPACGQDLPAERVEAARAKALADFNEKKAGALTEISARGRARKAEVADLVAKTEEGRTKTRETADAVDAVEADIAALDAQIRSAETSVPAPAPGEDDERRGLLERKAALESAVSELQFGNRDALAEVEADIGEIDEQIRGREKELAAIEACANTEARIRELEAREKALGEEYEKLEGELYLCERFIVRKVELLTERINCRFKVARFVLFRTLINGEIEECAEVQVNGVPYNSLNNGMRINAGLDICETLSEFYGIRIPVFIDNAEAVNRLYRTAGQQIRLVVSEDKALRIEVEDGNERKAA
ncbi:MAG TPA: AAA family ATPase [Syntrophobacter fumaroxidans]|nr:AAA family ATPase [Syntrophobacter fumaroxidans]